MPTRRTGKPEWRRENMFRPHRRLRREQQGSPSDSGLLLDWDSIGSLAAALLFVDQIVGLIERSGKLVAEQRFIGVGRQRLTIESCGLGCITRSHRLVADLG